MEKKELIKKEKEFVIPGEEIVRSTNYLPGKNCFREGESIISKKIGLVSLDNRVISVIPLNSVYIPHVKDMVIGEIVELQGNGWVVDIQTPNTAFMSLSGVREFVKSGSDLSKYYSVGDTIYAKIYAVNGDSTYLSMQDSVARKLREGVILKINPAKVPRLIGKQGSMIKTIKDKTDCRISVGQNGLIWVLGDKINLVRKAVELIEKESFADGLTEKVSELLDKENKSKDKKSAKKEAKNAKKK